MGYREKSIRHDTHRGMRWDAVARRRDTVGTSGYTSGLSVGYRGQAVVVLIVST